MKKTQVLIVGTGLRAGWFIKAIPKRRDAAIAALCDTVPGKAEDTAKRYGLGDVRIFNSVEKALAGVDCDAVFVLTPDGHHAEVMIPVLKAGKYVYCEKPLEITLPRCRRIMEADRKAGGKTFVGFNLRYAPLYEMVKQRIDAGDIGDVLTIQADEFYDGGRTYFRRWNRLRSEGGGLWITKASHDFDLISWFAGTRPLEAHAVAAKTHYRPKKGAARLCRDCRFQDDCFDCAPRHLRESDRNAPRDMCLYNTESDTFDHGIATIKFERDIFATYTCNVVAGFTDRRIRVSGTKGTLDGNFEGDALWLRKRDPTWLAKISLSRDKRSHGGSDDRILEGFMDFVKGRAAPKCRPSEAALAVAIGLAATRSSDSGRVVKIA
jgi:predicted dehydrogenase